MKNYLLVLLLGLSMTGAVVAGPGHEHGHSHGPISADKAKQEASQKVEMLIKKGKLDASWQSVLSSAKVEKKTFSKGPEWVVSFKNSKVSDQSKQTLYVFYSLDGHYLAANFTGN